MADEEPLEEDEPKKKSKLPLIIGLVLMLVLGGGGFFAVYSGMILGSDVPTDMADAEAHEEVAEAEPLPDVAYVPIEPLIVNLTSPNGQSKHLRFHAQLEVPSNYEMEVTKVLPRMVDILNGYLRALDIHELEDPSALIRLRAQMLRRMKIAAGEERVRDVLIMEFVIN